MAHVADGGGGGRAGTNFFAYDVPGMWRLVENQETDPHWQHVSGLTKTYDLCLYHLSTLRRYRSALAEAWPPEKSPASRAYLTRLDHLIDHVQQTYDITTNNHKLFSTATGALSSARRELKKIYDEYQANQQRLDVYHAEQARNATPQPSAAPSPTPQPRPAPGPPPVAPGRQEELNKQARALMYRLSAELLEARTRLKHPPPYELKTATYRPDKIDHEPGYSGTPPYIPPIVPAPVFSSPASAPVQPLTQAPVPAPTGAAVGPILGGVTTPAPPPPAGPVLGPAPAPAHGPLPGSPIGPMPGALPRLPSRPTPTDTGGFRGGAPNGAPLGARPTVLPPGGVIGGPTTGPLTPHHTARPIPRGVNPAGGIIGQPAPGQHGVIGQPGAAAGRGVAGASTPSAAAGGRRTPGGVTGASASITGITGAPAGSSLSAAAGQPWAPTSGGRSNRDAECTDPQHRRWDPDNPWEIDPGVDPVILPPPSPPPIDPGPVIGGTR